MIISINALATGIYQSRHEPQKVTLITNGLAALQLRLEMIARAKKTIDMEYFIYDVDSSSRLITHALIKKVRDGVKVRLLVDTFPSYTLTSEYAMAMKMAGIEVKYYNSTALIRFIKVQFRSHRKSLIIDDMEGITGGRNIADEYFDMSPEYNFMDTDLHIKGSIAKGMKASFLEFWNSNFSEVPTDLVEPRRSQYPDMGKYHTGHGKYSAALNAYRKKIEQAVNFITPTETDRETLKNVNTHGRRLLAKEFTTICNDTIFAADTPGIGPQTRVLTAQLQKLIYGTKKEIYVESPYFVTQEKSFPMMYSLLNRGVSVNVLTNSLFSTDNFLTQSAFDTRIPLWTASGMNVWMHNGSRNPKKYPVFDSISDARWGTHSKRAVIDGETTIVGTFNFDPRSANINAEMALICRNNPALAKAMRNDIQSRMQDAIPLDKSGMANGSYVRNQSPLSKRIKFWLALPLANAFSFLL